jgi:hypothetical protein
MPNRQQDFNSPSYYAKGCSDKLRYKLRRLNFAIEPSKTQKRVTRQRCAKNSRGDWTQLELFVAGVRGCEAGMRRILIEDSNAGRP